MAKTLLLADDSVTIQKVVGISFAGEDVDLITVDNGDDAITKAREARPDIVLTDVVMPGKNGYEVCEAIKSDPTLAHIPVLLLTGTFEAFDEERATRCGAAGHVAKPFEAQTLVDRVAQLLASAPPPAAAPADSAPITQPQVIGQTPIAQRPAPEGASAADSVNDQSFDFFDDELAAPPPAASAPAGAVDFDDADRAFAFGDDDLGASAPAGEHTVAMIPDASEPSLASPPATPFDYAQAAPPAPPAEDELLSSAIEAPGSPADRFDFENGDSFGEADLLAPLGDDELGQETILDPKGASGYDVSSSDLSDAPVPGGPDTLEPIPAAVEPAPQPIRDDATVMVADTPPAPPAPDPAQIGSDLFADDEPLSPAPPTDYGRDTVLDGPEPAPMQADDPSLDAMIPAAPEPTPPPAPIAAPEPIVFEEPPAPPPVPAAQPMPAAPMATQPPADPMPIAEPAAAPEPTPEPVATPEPIAPLSTEPMAPPEAQPVLDAITPTAAPPMPEPMAPPEAQPVSEPEPMALSAAPPVPMAELMVAADPAPEPAAGPDTASVADAVMARIEPHLREQLHDTLEKIAWESFGDVTEQIVRQALEHVERVAWEVIPQMAETMIREEIKKLKGEG